jgi:nucleoside-diphosphate-sugar epimerase
MRRIATAPKSSASTTSRPGRARTSHTSASRRRWRSCVEGKRCAEALATSYAQEFGVDVRIVRIFNTYGPRMHEPLP